MATLLGHFFGGQGFEIGRTVDILCEWCGPQTCIEE